MVITTTTPTEANLEARANATLRAVFPAVRDLRHQLRFKVRLGRHVLEAGSRDYVDGRADIIVYQGDTPLAVVELKREGLALTEDDEEQGRSYAIWCQAPIFVVTNGTDTRIFQTHDKSRIDGMSIDGAEVARRFQSAATAAKADATSAIRKLLGKSLSSEALKSLTESELCELTGDWAEGNRFVEKFLVRRKATATIKKFIGDAEKRVVLVVGPPLSGKSNVLRELALDEEWDGGDVLYLDGGACGEGIFRRLANVLESQFSWPATLEDARQWLRQLSNRAERKTIFCIDSPKLTNATFRGELDELISTHFGKQLVVILAVDENDVQNLVMTENLREQSKLGKKSVEVAVGKFDDDEFKDATRNLDELGGRLVYGAQFAQELRAPWVLRTLAAAIMSSRKPDDFLSVLPPMLGREMLHIADRRFQSLGDARESFARLAKLYVDSCESKSSAIDMLASIYMFSIPKELAKDRMDRQDLNELIQIGLVRKSKAPSGKPVFAVRAPELFGHEISQVLAKRLAKRLQRDADGATAWFVRVCSRIPLGDSIGAQAIYRLLLDDKIAMAIDLINRLFSRPPVRESIPPGSEMMMLDPEVGLMHFHVDENGALRVRHGNVISEPIPVDDGDDEMVRFSSFDPWMILSQLRAYGVLLESEEGHPVNLASVLVFSLASCPMILRKPGKAIDELHSHSFDGVEVSCYSNGMIEPVTWSIAELFSNTTIMGVDRDQWVSEALASENYPLINRMAQALRHVSQLEGHGEWAQRMLDDHCLPALRAQPFFHS